MICRNNKETKYTKIKNTGSTADGIPCSDCRQKPDLRNKVSGFFYEEKCCKTLKFQRIKPVI